MRIEESFTLDAPVENVHEFLSDVHRVARCVPGVGEVTQREDGAYEATLQIQMGPIKAAFAGEVTLTTSTDPYRLEAEGRGQDRSSGSRAEIAFTGDLHEADGGTTLVETGADVTIRGRLGQFGTGVIKATATEVIRDFVACANETLAAEAAPARVAEGDGGTDAVGGDAGVVATAERSPAPAATPTGFGKLLLRIVRTWLVDTFRRLVSFLTRRK